MTVKEKKMKTMDGNTAAAYASYAFTDVAAIYPITPSSPMAEEVDNWSAHGQKNLFGQEVKVLEMQSEGGAAGALHGSLAAGALTTTYTASQGLLLMIPNMYKIAGELLPGVFHVTARTLAAHALCIFGDHSDVMATRQTGFAMLASDSVQTVMDLGGIAHLASIKARVPFLHFFDGFRTSHEVMKIEMVDYDVYRELIDMEAVQEFRDRALNPEHPVIRGTAQNPDIFFQAREASNQYYEAVPEIVADYMKRFAELTGREYHLFDYVGDPDATDVIVAMGSVCDTIEETIPYLQAQGRKVGLIKVRLYRPFAPEYMKAVMPKTVERIAVIDRTKEPGAVDEPLCMDVKTMYFNQKNAPKIYGGRYGLGSKDTTPGQIVAIYDNLAQPEPKDHFTIGIEDDVTYTSLKEVEGVRTEKEGTVRCKFWGLGSDGTVGANKNSIKVIGDNTDMYAQGYFSYDSKKSGGVTISHLRFGKERIRSPYLIQEADFVACHKKVYVEQYDLLKGLKDGGTFLLNCDWDDQELGEQLPASMRRYIATHKINFYTIHATHIAREIGMGERINTIMQAAFFKLANVIPEDKAIQYLKDAAYKSYHKKGEEVLQKNYKAIECGMTGLHKVEVPVEWADAQDVPKESRDVPEFIEKILEPMNKQEGDQLPVSAFVGREDGTFPSGTAAYEKRGVAIDVPEWNPQQCIQCNQCAFICPHSAIRPILVTPEEKANAPKQFEAVPAKGKGLEGLEYRMQISALDCMGCGNCADICPAKESALIMKPLATQLNEAENWKFAMSMPAKDDRMEKTSVKGSQFAKPYFEFSGACAGCGETPYMKVVTQLFGDRMLIANATGCSSIWGASTPSMPYCKDEKGRGPAWANSLFEDNAEYGLGMAMGVKQIRTKLEENMKALLECELHPDFRAALEAWLAVKDDGEKSRAAGEHVLQVIADCRSCKTPAADDPRKLLVDEILERKDFLTKPSVWAVGGDGWAYDIGYGGLDHVLASGEDINILVFDTEVYSNTGGQSSKATPAAAVAKFAASGKKIKKKDLGMMAMSYGYVYVAQVGMGADKAQFLKAVQEAESYKGPSLIICYSPCINHGLKKGMGKTQLNMKEAVDAGYWHLYRYNPERKEEGKNPFVLDSKEPTASFREYLMNQSRYTSLLREFPDSAEELFAQAEADAKERYENYKKLAK